MTRFCPAKRINYVFPSFLLSVHSAAIFRLFKTNESKLHWYILLLSLKLFLITGSPSAIDHADPVSDYNAYSWRLDILHRYTCFTVSFLTGLFCFVIIVTACLNYGNYTLVFSLPWYVEVFKQKCKISRNAKIDRKSVV